MQRTAAGDPSAPALLDARYRRTLTRYARSLLGRSHHDAEDVVQDVLFRAHQEIVAGRGPEQLDAWLHRLTRNRAIDEMRRARWGEASLDALPGGGDAMRIRALGIGRGAGDGEGFDGRAINDPAAVFHRREAVRALVQDLADLPVAQREAILTRVVDGCSPAESAEQLGVSVEAVQMLVVRGRANLTRIRELRGASGDLDHQLRLLAPPAVVVPLTFGIAKLFGLGGGKVVGVVVAAIAVVATATGLEVSHTQRASAGQPAPFNLVARQSTNDYFDYSVRRGQPIPPDTSVLSATVTIPAGTVHAKDRQTTLQCPFGQRGAAVLNVGDPGYHPPVAYRAGNAGAPPRADGRIQVVFASTVLAKPATVKVRVLCRKPGVGGTVGVHPRVPQHGDGAGYVCTFTELFLQPHRTIVGTLTRGTYLTVLRRTGHVVFVIAPYEQRGWVRTDQLCRGWTLPTRPQTGPALFPLNELGAPYGRKGFAPASAFAKFQARFDAQDRAAKARRAHK